MKLLIGLLTLVSLNALALDVCQFQETIDLEESLETDGIFPRHVSLKKLDAFERKLFSEMLGVDSFCPEDVQDGGIKYYKLDGEELIVVHHYPGDNEVGFIYRKKNGKLSLLAAINDAYIECE